MGARNFYQGTCFTLTNKAEEKPVLILAHGVGLNQDLWDSWLPLLTQDYAVLTFDLLGHGESHNPLGDRVILDFVNQLDGLLNYLNIDKAILCGYSLGAVISLAYASLHSNRLSHMILLHVVCQRSEAQRRSVRERYQITRNEGSMATVELAITRWFSERFQNDNPVIMDQLRQTFRQHTGDGYFKAYHLFSDIESQMRKYDLSKINLPALIVTGEKDVGSTPAMSESLASDLPDATLIINPDHRHGGPVEFAAVMASQVISFLKSDTVDEI